MDENNQHDVLAQSTTEGRLAYENAELRRRLAELQQNVVDGGFKGEVPSYKLNDPIFIDDTYFEAGSIIETFEVPNLSMVPRNDSARRAIELVIEHQEEGARMVAAQRGRVFHGLVTDRGVLLADALEHAKETSLAPTIAMPQERGQVPAMPHTVDALAQQRRGRGRPKKVVSSQPPAPMKPDTGAPMLPAVVGRMAV